MGWNGHEGVLEARTDRNDHHDRDHRHERTQKLRQVRLERSDGRRNKLRHRLHRGDRHQRDAHGDQSDVDEQAAWNRPPIAVEKEDADYRTQSRWTHDEEEVLGTKPEDLGCESWPQRAHDADQR